MPLRKAFSRGSLVLDDEPQQAGRSAASLQAHAAAAQSMQELSRQPLYTARSVPSLSARPLQPEILSPPSPSAGAPLLPQASPPVPPPRRSAANPVQPSLRGSRPSDESRQNEQAAMFPARAVPASQSPDLIAPSGAPPLAPPLVPSRLKPPDAMDDSGLSPPITPKPSQSVSDVTSMRGLGSDYTRYFNPFADSRRSSLAFTDSKTKIQSAEGLAVTEALLKHQRSAGAHPQNPFEPIPGTPSPESDRDRTLGTQASFSTYFDDRLIAPFGDDGTYNFPMLVTDKEADDDMHMPRADDDLLMKPKFKEHFTRENIVSTLGLFLLLFGVIFLFIILPVLSTVGVININWAWDTPLDQMPGHQNAKIEGWRKVNDLTYPLLKNIRKGLIDPDTPKSAKTAKGVDGDTLNLVFSDEFNDSNRTFYPGDDPYFFAGDFWYGATQDLDWYDPDAVTTWDGTLEIRLDEFTNHNLKFRSGMLNSWNQLCFKGGRLEVGLSLPGPAGIMGLWPGAWTMGNLGRPGYLSTTDGMWPYTYDKCDAGITPNQSMTDGTSFLPGQRLPSCTCHGEDHPTPGNGRGAPEIDILEASASYAVKGLPVVTQSYQVAPFDIWWLPNYEFMEFPDYSVSFTNTYTGGPYQQAVSATTMTNKDWFDGNEYQKYAFEYTPTSMADDGYGAITWFVGDDEVWKMDGRSIGPNGNVGQRLVSEEPMSIILNLGLSNSWVQIDWANLKFPTVMRFDYVRLYQKDGDEMVTCDPPGYETTQYITDHMPAYTNPNFTKWDQTGYGWPKHKLNSNC